MTLRRTSKRSTGSKARADGSSEAAAVVTQTNAQDSDLGDVRGLSAAYLIVEGSGARRTITVERGTAATVGRSPECTVVTNDSRASRIHARISWSDSSLVIEDLESRNGTWIDGSTIRGSTRALSGSETIVIADLRIIVALASAAETSVRAVSQQTSAPEPKVVIADPKMRELFAIVRRLADTSSTVLFLGETGVGKEVIGEQLHRLSARADRPFVRINCAALPESLLESQLFGHERGAFTGALEQHQGYFEAAEGGTLFLDEIGEISPASQTKLLSVLENRRLTRVGSTKETAVDVRILCATHRDLVRDVEEGRFRRDLFYRISTFKLTIPPLRERPIEIGLLSELFSRSFAQGLGRTPPAIDPALVELLLRHRWPGNVRELRNAIEHAVIMADGRTIRIEHLPAEISEETAREEGPPELRTGDGQPSEALEAKLSAIERTAILEALLKENGNQTRAAKRLGITRRALIYKMGRLGI
jgi:two-component system, NtrC family, response regulator AtoC